MLDRTQQREPNKRSYRQDAVIMWGFPLAFIALILAFVLLWSATSNGMWRTKDANAGEAHVGYVTPNVRPNPAPQPR